MCVRYSGAKNRHSYNCSRTTSSYGDPLCQSLSGPVLDELITGRILAAVEPAALEASLAAVKDDSDSGDNGAAAKKKAPAKKPSSRSKAAAKS